MKKKLKFSVSNVRESELLDNIFYECKFCLENECKFYIDKINGLTSALYILDIIKSPMIIANYSDVYELMNLINDFFHEYKRDIEEV